VKQARPDHASFAPLFLALNQAAMRGTQPALSPRELLAFPAAPAAPLPATVRLAEVGAPLGTLPAVLDLAPLPSAVPHAAVRPASGTLGAAGYGTPFPAPMCHAVVCAAVDALRAYPAAVVEAPFAAAVPLAERGAPLRAFSAAGEYAPLSAAVSFA